MYVEAGKWVELDQLFSWSKSFLVLAEVKLEGKEKRFKLSRTVWFFDLSIERLTTWFGRKRKMLKLFIDQRLATSHLADKILSRCLPFVSFNLLSSCLLYQFCRDSYVWVIYVNTIWNWMRYVLVLTWSYILVFSLIDAWLRSLSDAACQLI